MTEFQLKLKFCMVFIKLKYSTKAIDIQKFEVLSTEYFITNLQ